MGGRRAWTRRRRWGPRGADRRGSGTERGARTGLPVGSGLSLGNIRARQFPSDSGDLSPNPTSRNLQARGGLQDPCIEESFSGLPGEVRCVHPSCATRLGVGRVGAAGAGAARGVCHGSTARGFEPGGTGRAAEVDVRRGRGGGGEGGAETGGGIPGAVPAGGEGAGERGAVEGHSARSRPNTSRNGG